MHEASGRGARENKEKRLVKERSVLECQKQNCRGSEVDMPFCRYSSLGGRTKTTRRRCLLRGSSTAAVKRANVKCQNGGLTFGGRSAMYLSLNGYNVGTVISKNKREAHKERQLQTNTYRLLQLREERLQTTTFRLLRPHPEGRLQTNYTPSA